MSIFRSGNWVMKATTFNDIQIGSTFLRLSDGHKFIKLPRYRSAQGDEEYNALNLDELIAEDAFAWFGPQEGVCLEREEQSQVTDEDLIFGNDWQQRKREL